MKVLLTGASGTIGNKVIEALLKKGNVEIVASSLNPGKAKQFDWYKKVQYIPYDLHDKKSRLIGFFQEPDVLIHLAWEGLPNYQSAHHTKINLPAHKYFLKTLIKEGLKNIVVAGTCFEYGMDGGECRESKNCKPTNQYGLAKYYLLKWLLKQRTDHDFNLTWLRLFYSIDPARKSSLFGQLQLAIEKNEEAFNMTGGEQIRDYLPIEKMINYIVEISMMQRNAGIVNCCSGNPKRVVDVVNDFLKRHNSNLEINFGVHPYSPIEPMAFWGNTAKLRSLLTNGIVAR